MMLSLIHYFLIGRIYLSYKPHPNGYIYRGSDLYGGPPYRPPIYTISGRHSRIDKINQSEIYHGLYAWNYII